MGYSIPCIKRMLVHIFYKFMFMISICRYDEASQSTFTKAINRLSKIKIQMNTNTTVDILTHCYGSQPDDADLKWRWPVQFGLQLPVVRGQATRKDAMANTLVYEFSNQPPMASSCLKIGVVEVSVTPSYILFTVSRYSFILEPSLCVKFCGIRPFNFSYFFFRVRRYTKYEILNT